MNNKLLSLCMLLVLMLACVASENQAITIHAVHGQIRRAFQDF